MTSQPLRRAKRLNQAAWFIFVAYLIVAAVVILTNVANMTSRQFGWALLGYIFGGILLLAVVLGSEVSYKRQREAEIRPHLDSLLKDANEVFRHQ